MLLQQEAWQHRPLLRELYTEWYGLIVARLSERPGPTIELGCGIGTFKAFHSPTVATDVTPTLWAEQVVDARQLPYETSSVANLVMIDVLHHVPQPLTFFDEAQRVLAPGGRLVMLEPYCGALSGLVFRIAHHEGANLRVDPFSPEPHSGEYAFDANNALPTLIFWRHLDRFHRQYPQFEIVQRERFGWLVYPLSGGFSRRRLVPYALCKPLQRVERALNRLTTAAAFRCLVTLERR